MNRIRGMTRLTRMGGEKKMKYKELYKSASETKKKTEYSGMWMKFNDMKNMFTYNPIITICYISKNIIIIQTDETILIWILEERKRDAMRVTRTLSKRGSCG